MKHLFTKSVHKVATATALGSVLVISATAPTLAGAMPKGHSDAGGYSPAGHQSPEAELAQIPNNPTAQAETPAERAARAKLADDEAEWQQDFNSRETPEITEFNDAGPVPSGN